MTSSRTTPAVPAATVTACATGPADTLLVELAGNEAPVTLSAAALPGHRLVIMPRRD